MSLTEEEISELRYAFHAFDANGSGFIEHDELHDGLKLLGWEISENGIQHLLQLVESKDDKLSFEEFVAANATLWKNDMKGRSHFGSSRSTQPIRKAFLFQV